MTNSSSSAVKCQVSLTGAQPGPAAQNRPTQATIPNEKYLSTDHLLGDLKGRTISGGFITIVAQGVQFVLNLGSIMVLARLLAPKDFGLYAMVTTVMGYLIVFMDAGLSTATVQRESITQTQVSNLFWINVALSAMAALVLAVSSPLVAWFFREPRLVAITLILSGTFFLGGVTVQHTALLKRQMRFKAIAFIQVTSTLTGIVFGVAMAWLGYRYWALVFSNVVTVAVAVPLTWCAIPWRPQLPSRGSGTGSLVRFGTSMAGGGFIYSLAKGADNLFVGRFYGADWVGLYSRAAALLNRPMEQFLYPISSVFVPALSRLQTQPERYRRTFLHVYESMTLLSFLSTGLLLALSRPLTLVVLGPRWEKAAIIFGALAVAALSHPLARASTWLFISQGRGGRVWLFVNFLGAGLTIGSFAAGLPFGPAGLAIAYSAVTLFIGVPILYYFAGREGPVTTADLWTGIFRYLPLWIVVCGVTWLVRLLLVNSSPLMQLVVCAPVGLGAGMILICLVTPMRRTALGLVKILPELKLLGLSFNGKQ
jgi:Membrane protein involved in the export of O-antigen and teichoic acid